MATKQSVTVSFEIIKTSGYGPYQARVTVQSGDEPTWSHYGFGKTPTEALDKAYDQVKADLNPRKRGRKARGHRSVARLGGWS